jgi:hypothetical protein
MARPRTGLEDVEEREGSKHYRETTQRKLSLCLINHNDMKAYGRTEVPHILNLGISWRRVVSITPHPFYLLRKCNQCTVDTRLCGFQGRSERRGEKVIFLVATEKSRDGVVGIAITRAGRPRVRNSSPGRVKNFLFSSSSRLTLESTQTPIQCVLGALSPGVEAARA